MKNKKTIESEIASALQEIGYDLKDIPPYAMGPGYILLGVDDNDEGEADHTIQELRFHLPAGATVEWTGNSDTNGDGFTTSDCEITW